MKIKKSLSETEISLNKEFATRERDGAVIIPVVKYF
jgi:hypothetical protein